MVTHMNYLNLTVGWNEDTYAEPKKKLALCLSVVAVLLKHLKMSNDLYIFGRTIICSIKQRPGS